MWIERHTFVIFSMSSSNNVYKTQHSGDVCRRLQADVGSQGNRTIAVCEYSPLSTSYIPLVGVVDIPGL